VQFYCLLFYLLSVLCYIIVVKSLRREVSDEFQSMVASAESQVINAKKHSPEFARCQLPKTIPRGQRAKRGPD
jgi:hypothetical protein